MCVGAGSEGWSSPNAAIRARARTFGWSAPTLAMNHSTRLSLKAQSFTESVIREMTRLNLELNGPDRAVNFAQGFPDFETDPRIIEAAAKALRDGFNQYATTWGAPQLRNAIARNQSVAWARDVDSETEVTVSCGATEAMIA